MCSSYVHTKWLNTQKEMHAGAARELQWLSDTRWACWHTACRTVLERLPAITHVFEEVAAENHGDRSIDAHGLLAQIDRQFIGLLVTCTKVFGDAKSLSVLPAQVTKKLAERHCIQCTSIVLIKSNEHKVLGIISTANRTKRTKRCSRPPLKGQAPFMSSAGRCPARWHIPIQVHTGSGLQDARAGINTLKKNIKGPEHSDILQSPSLDLCSAVDLVEALVQSFQDYRDESYFETLWKEVLNTAEKCDVETEPIPKRQSIQSRMLDGHTVMSSVGERSELIWDSFRTSIILPSA